MTVAPRFILVARDGQIVEGKLFGTSAGDLPLLLVRLRGVLHAIGRICTHEDQDLAEGWIQDGCVVCPRHGSQFDLVTGDALSLPAFEPEPVFEVLVLNGLVYVAVPEQAGA